ncbi:hypothetical protein AwWohl_10820 [Gammaproteobacteria bacterium]|nr:hypothetical protein AwWohl_10820 [Gammaproteobacteria bacterium]
MPDRALKSNFQAGSSLLELVAVLALIAIISAFSVPSLQSMLLSYRLNSAARAMLVDFQFALRIAQNSGTWVSLCISDDQKSCALAGDLYNWQRGWIIFKDPKANFSVESANILKKRSGFDSSISHISGRNIKNAMRLSGTRRFGTTAGTGLPNGRMMFCSTSNKHQQIDLIVNIFGEARLEKQKILCQSIV